MDKPDRDRAGDRRGEPRRGTSRPASIGGILESVVAALVPLTKPIEAASPVARRRRDVSRELERIIERALWRVEKRSRRVGWHVRRSASWIMAERRWIAYEVMRALTSLGAGDALARRIAEHAAERFPRDGIIVEDRKGPRVDGTAPRQRGTHPRANGSNPRARGESPRQRRAPADLSRESDVSSAVAELERNNQQPGGP